MSQRRSQNSSGPQETDGKKASNRSSSYPKHKENVIRKLYETFQDSFDLALIATVAHTCQWDLHTATEALLILSGRKDTKRSRASSAERKNGTKSKAKSLPGTLKPEKSSPRKGLNSSNSAHYSSTNSLSSGQVWQRHYKSKPQSPGLLTMIPPSSKEIVKLKTPEPVKYAVESEFKKASSVIRKIQQMVQNGQKVMILMRGLPGSGKTHLAQVVVSLVTGNELSQHIFSTDDYFIMLGRGSYAYDFNQLPQAHNWNQKRVSEAIKRGINPVVVDNTNTQAWEMQPYVYMAVAQGYTVEVLEPVTEWRNKEAELAKRNVHSVPREKIRQMSERYEPGWTGEKLIKSFGFKYKHGCPTQPVGEEVKRPTNSLLAQHRQNAIVNVPEKPKRKKSSSKSKDRSHHGGPEMGTEDREKQMEELNKLFAEYGKTMDPASRQKVIESGVPISEVVSRMRKLQGNILPMPLPSEQHGHGKECGESSVVQPVPAYSGTRRDSIPESIDPDTMSSSNASETSECDTDIDSELPKWKEMRRYFDYGEPGHFVVGEDLLEDYDDSERQSGHVQAKSLRQHGQGEFTPFLAYADNQTSASQDDLSLLNYDGTDNPTSGESSPSSEEQESQMLSLQASLREALLDKVQMENEPMSSDHSAPRKNLDVSTDFDKSDVSTKAGQIELTDSLMDVLNRRFEASVKLDPKSVEGVSLNESLLQILVKKYSAEEAESSEAAEEPNRETADDSEYKKSPDLEEVPLPSIPSEPGEDGIRPPPGLVIQYKAESMESSKTPTVSSSQQDGSGFPYDWCGSKRDKFEDIVNSWDHAAAKETKTDESPKEARPRNNNLGAIKKTGVHTRDKSPEELLRSVDLSWSSIPFTSSWEDVSKKAKDPEAGRHLPKPQRKSVVKTDSSTNTLHSDFDLWKKDEDGLVRLRAHSRNINENYVEPEMIVCHATELLMLDKGSMTLDVEEVQSIERASAIETLSGMFPDISREYLVDIFDKCKGNLVWAIEVLLETPQNLANLTHVQQTEDSARSFGEIGCPSETDYKQTLQSVVISDGKKTIKRKKDKKSATSESSLLLKKQIEESIQINEDAYQDKTLFLKKLRHGEIEMRGEPVMPMQEYQPEGFAEPGKEMEESEEEEEGTISMKIDPEFFKTLTNLFGPYDGNATDKQSNFFPPTINIPISLAQQLYDCCVESVNKQLEDMQSTYDKMIMEDELLATAIQEQELEYRQPDLREIMDMELAMLLYKQNKAQLHEYNQETIATKLSKQLLFEAFPKMDKKMLSDLFESEGRSFQRTIDVLNSQENQSPMTVIAPEFLAARGSTLIEQAKSEVVEKNMDGTKKPIIIVKPRQTRKEISSDKNVLLVNPMEYRQKTALLHQQRNECCRLAQEAFRKKSYSVSSYFSHIASLYKEKIKDLSKEPFPPTLFDDKANGGLTKIDLHFLLVPEALQILDLFLDHHIRVLRKNLLPPIALDLITGRGQHSFKGKSRIKPAVMKRLEQRRLRFAMVNPGMFTVKVHKNDLLSDEM